MQKFTSLMLVFLFIPTVALACQCRDQNVESNYEKSKMVVYANVQDFIASPAGEGGTAVLVITHWWKSSSPDKIVVNTLTNCNFNFVIGGNYLLFLNLESNGFYYTDNCSGNMKLSLPDEHNSVLSKLKKMRSDSN